MTSIHPTTLHQAACLGLVVLVKALSPAWVTSVSRGVGPRLLKFWYPFVATIAVLHHARTLSKKDKKKSKKGDKSTDTVEDKPIKKRSRRRRSSIGALLNRTPPIQQNNGDDNHNHDGYTEEQLNEDATYWLNYWLLYSVLKTSYSLATKLPFVNSLVTADTTHSVLCQLDFLFYIWIFFLPECFLILFPTNVSEEERQKWSPSHQWCYDCAVNPVLAIPSLFLPIIVPCYEKVSQVVSPEDWKKYVVDNVEKLFSMACMFNLISPQKKEALLEHTTNFNPLVIPALTLLMPGCITQYGVLYVQCLVPQAYSYRALARERRQAERILYLKFWVIHALAGVPIHWANTVLFFIPLKTHTTFIVWCGLVLNTKKISSIYEELDQELQAFRLLPEDPIANVGDDMSVATSRSSIENTHSYRALSILYASLPKADDVNGSIAEIQSGEDDDGSDDNRAATTYDSEDDDDDDDSDYVQSEDEDLVEEKEMNPQDGTAKEEKSNVNGKPVAKRVEKENRVRSSISKNKSSFDGVEGNASRFTRYQHMLTKVRCCQCNELGHLKRDCPRLHNNQQPETNRGPTAKRRALRKGNKDAKASPSKGSSIKNYATMSRQAMEYVSKQAKDVVAKKKSDEPETKVRRRANRRLNESPTRKTRKASSRTA